jgi:HAMP domain-containing protein
MRDPLHRLSVRTKLALLFVGLCLLAYGVGGVLVSREAEAALDRQIRARLEFQCRAWAGALDGSLAALSRRAEDFASDGLIRGHAERLQQELDPEERERVRLELADHLTRNKLPLVPAFADLAVAGSDGVRLVTVHGIAQDGLDAAARSVSETTRAGALIGDGTGASGSTLSLATPLRALDGTQNVGRLIALVRAEVWVHDAVAAVAGAEDEAVALGEDVELVLHDPAGRSLAVNSRARPVLGNFSRSFPLAAEGWAVEVRLDAGGAWLPVAGLKSRFLGVGLVLAALSLLLLFFPMQFVARPLGRLTRAAERLSEGDVAVRVDVDSDDEIGDLGRAFNGMAAAIAERTHSLETVAAELRARQGDLRAGRDRLQAVIGAMHDGLIVLDGEGRVTIANAAARPVLDLVERGAHASGHNLCRETTPKHGDCFGCLLDVEGPPRSCVVDADGPASTAPAGCSSRARSPTASSATSSRSTGSASRSWARWRR